jgi:hypothetical protein
MRVRYLIHSGLFAASLITATDAIAQTVDGQQSEEAAAVSLSVAPLKEIFGGSGFLASAQVPLTSMVYVEGAFTQNWDDRLGFQHLGISAVGANLILRAGSPRWGGYFGAGLGLERSRLDQEPIFGPFGALSDRVTSAVRYGLAGQVMGGAEASISRHLKTFGEVRVRSDLRNAMRVGIAGGLRTMLSARPTPPRQPVDVGTRAARPGKECG